jgi:hypothetical protein
MVEDRFQHAHTLKENSMAMKFGVYSYRKELAATTMILVMAGGLTIVAFAAEKKIARSALPPAVEKTVQAQSKGAAIKGFTVENENGKLDYEVEMTVNGHGKDVSIAADGAVLESEEEIPFDSLPAAAKRAILASAGKAKIVKVEAMTTGDKVTSYEAHTLNGAKRSEISVSPSGKRVAD